MPSVVGLLVGTDQGARQRVEVLREAADRVLAELRDAEPFWERFVMAGRFWPRFLLVLARVLM
ncbi:hypothetical protein OHB49_44975 (plasmid) [Streptomyces sp. NBC_01717]|uniref:hypothetical protein n=1 Tax=Streptomyces sp. NBC_01717 TaxID=2975918 RepID=UPI002E3310E9|nr:hypothetical protein [Streptomyces sp. NBC_01717]